MPKAYWRKAGAVLFGLLLLAGCRSLSDSLFLLSRLEDTAKSQALAEQGAAYYQRYLVNRGEYFRIPEIRRYFEAALRYDSDNAKAQAYLEKIDNFRAIEGGKRLGEAQALLKKAKRSQEEDYLLCLAVQKACQLMPESAEANALRQQTAALRGSLVEAYLRRSQMSLALLEGQTPPQQENILIESVRSLNRVLALDPQHSAARSRERELRPQLGRIFDRRRKEAERKIEGGKFPEAAEELAFLKELNRSLGHPFDRELNTLAYSLNLRWARALLDRREYAAAETRVEAALAVRRTEEAAALKRRITGARAASAAGASFENGLRQVDRLIAQGELAEAHRRLQALARLGGDSARSASLAARRELLRAQLPILYQRAVSAYKAEEYPEAIELLQTVVQIEATYEQAAEYLEKALVKQRLLEQYTPQ